MEHINNQFITILFGGAQVALSTWTGVLLFIAINDKDPDWVYRAMEAKWMIMICLLIGIMVTLYNAVRGHYAEAVATSVIALLWFLFYKARREHI